MGRVTIDVSWHCKSQMVTLNFFHQYIFITWVDHRRFLWGFFSKKRHLQPTKVTLVELKKADSGGDMGGSWPVLMIPGPIFFSPKVTNGVGKPTGCIFFLEQMNWWIDWNARVGHFCPLPLIEMHAKLGFTVSSQRLMGSLCPKTSLRNDCCKRPFCDVPQPTAWKKWHPSIQLSNRKRSEITAGIL